MSETTERVQLMDFEKKAGRKVTIVDVAAAAKVSIGTVSRYINGLPVRKPEQIRDAIAALGYSRNALAGSIRAQATRTVGILLPNFDEFHARILTGISDSLRQSGYSGLTARFTDLDRSLDEAVDFLVSRRVDGLIVGNLPSANSSLERIAQTELPMVFYNAHPPDWEVDRVEVENVEVTTRAVEHLLDIGHQRIGIVTGEIGQQPADDRLHGYHKALIKAGVARDGQLEQSGKWSRRGGHEAAKRLLSAVPPPTAIFSSNYQMTVGVLQLIRERGLRIPQDISLIGFDDADLFALLDPGITVVSQPLTEIAREVADLMIDRLTGDREHGPRSVRLECNIVLRGSTRPLTPQSGPATA